jgi:hypothetical protein
LITLDSGTTISPSINVGTTARGFSFTPFLLVFAGPQVQVAAFPIEFLLGQAEAHLLSATRHVVMIKRKHDSSPSFGNPRLFAKARRDVCPIRVADRNIKRPFRVQGVASAVQVVQSALRLSISCSFPFKLSNT